MRNSKRRRLQLGTEPSARIQIWLDRLPQEVCQRVVLHVCRGAQNSDALALAETSETQRTAVLSVLGYRLTIHDRRCVGASLHAPAAPWQVTLDIAPLQAWMKVMGDEVVELAQPFLWNLLALPPPRVIASAISRPNLRVAEITDHPSQVHAVAKSSSIQKLTLNLEHRMPAKVVFDAVRHLRLVKLEVRCTRTESGDYTCPFQDTELTGVDSTGLAEYVPCLKSLHLRCWCFRRDELHKRGMFKLWRVVTSLRSVREVCCGWDLPVDRIPQEALMYLQSRDAVRIINCSYASQVCSGIGGSVREVSFDYWFSNDPLTRAEVSSLRNHPRLEAIAVKIEEGSEVLLPEVVAHLPELETLDIFWVHRGRTERRRCVHSGRGHATAPPGVMLRAVRAAARLSTVCLMDVRIPLSEVLAILEWCGSRLRVFKTSVMDQEETPFVRLESLLFGLTKYNRELRRFHVCELSHERGPLERGEWVEQGRRALARLGMFRGRVPGVYVGVEWGIGTLETEIRELIGWEAAKGSG